MYLPASARPVCELLGAAEDSTTTQIFKSSDYLTVWNKRSERGATTATGVPTHISNTGEFALYAATDFIIEPPRSTTRSWHDHHSGITPLGAAVVAVVVTALTYGTALKESAAFFTSTAAQTAAASATAAAASSVAVQALSNEGKIDWNQVFKAAAVAGVSAGLTSAPLFEGGTQSLNDLAGLGVNKYGLLTATGEGGLSLTQLAAIGGRGLINASLGSLAYGEDFGAGFRNSAVGDLSSLAAHAIGDSYGHGKNPGMQIGGHMALGALTAKATGQDPKAGALGGLVEGMISNLVPEGAVKPDSAVDQALYLGGVSFVAGLAADKVGLDPVTAAKVAENAGRNNYLYSSEARELEELKNLKMFGRCDTACDNRIRDLQVLDVQRNNDFNACGGVSSGTCDSVRQDARNAAASYVRAGTASTPGSIYGDKNAEARRYALDTMPGSLSSDLDGLGLGYLEVLADGMLGLGQAVWTGGKAVLGDGQAQAQAREGIVAAWAFASDFSNWPELFLGALSPADQERLAQAYEKGDRETINQMTGAALANFPVTGAGVGTTRKVIRASEAATIARVEDKIAGGANSGERVLWGSWKDYPKVTVEGREYAQVGDRLYTEHAINRTQPSVVS